MKYFRHVNCNAHLHSAYSIKLTRVASDLNIEDHNQIEWPSSACEIETLKVNEVHAIDCVESSYRVKDDHIYVSTNDHPTLP